MQNKNCNVLIVGFGPTGAVLANLLSKYHLSIHVLEKESQVYNLPRAVHFDDEIMRIFKSIGIFKKFLKKTIINKGTKFVDEYDNIILDWPRPKKITENGFYPSYRFHQPDLEKILRKNLIKNKKIKISYNSELLKISDKGDFISAKYFDKVSNSCHIINADYVVGCDGANSFVKEYISQEIIDFGFEEKWAVIDLIMKQNNNDLPDRTIQYCSKKTPATYCRNVGRRRRWEFSLDKNSVDKEVLNDDKIWHFLSKWITPEDATIERKTIYTFKSLVAKKWRKGRVFIAGDAAHLSPPFMGQGMCSGIRDVSNLFWKIAYCCNFGYKEKLLKTYESERLKNVKEYIITTINMGRLLNSIGDTNVSNTVKEEKDGSKKMNSIKPPLGPGLGDNKDKLRGKIFPYINLQNSNVSNFDTQFETELVLLSKQNLDNKKIKHINVNKYEEVMKVFNKLNISALILRPDRFILSSLNDNSNINDFIEKSTLQFG